MKLDFKRIEICNFMSFENEVFDFTQRSGMILVRGINNDIPNVKNGSGKSNLWNAVLYCLFGQLQDEIKNQHIINRYTTDGDMRLLLYFDVDGVAYTVIRGIKNKKASYFQLMRGEDDISKSTIAETQEFLEAEIIRCDISIFLRTILLTAGRNYNFYELKKQEKKEFVEKLFDISVFGDMYKLIHKDLLQLDKDILASQNRLIVMTKSLNDYTSRMQSYDAELNIKLANIGNAIKSEKCQLLKLSEQVKAQNDRDMKKINEAIEKIAVAVRGIRNKINAATDEKQQAQLKIRGLEQDKKSKEQIIVKHSSILQKLCNDCRDIFKQHYKIDKYEQDISSAQDMIAKLSDTASLASKHITDLLEQEKKLTLRLTQANEKISKQSEQNNIRNKKVTELEQHILLLENDYARIKDGKNPYIELQNNAKQQVEQENTTLSDMEHQHKLLLAAESIVSHETLRKLIISDLIGLLNNKIKKYLMKLGSKYTVTFDSDMDYEFTIPEGSCEFWNFSAGERMRIMVATSFAFRDFMSIRNGLNSNILVLDEYFDSAIDSACVESILGILREYMNSFQQNIYVISHRQEITPEQFDSVMQIEKTNDISRIRYLK